ncbi:hypothetical protein GI374_03225 [Paracoccus sp. S-4012]|uniref:hypothetical protein n=1 Tax=Paracoccus sp. S-4012 TaxID=2665648 RepID=UPI0012AFA407|nr:hypothetical protein [Paracoccus sp. S-4012]MRX49473.1 hypothetical protein [Paracoccus sp. S-4012]
MANDMPNMPLQAAEVASFTTPLASCFSTLLTALANFVSAESDLSDVDYWDPAYSRWRHDAESAQDEVVDALRSVHGAGVKRPEDVPMRRLALLVDGMMGSDNRRDFDRLHRLTSSNAALFRCAGSSTAARRVDNMLVAGLALVDELAGLDLYRGSSPEDDPGDRCRRDELLPALS